MSGCILCLLELARAWQGQHLCASSWALTSEFCIGDLTSRKRTDVGLDEREGIVCR